MATASFRIYVPLQKDLEFTDSEGKVIKLVAVGVIAAKPARLDQSPGRVIFDRSDSTTGQYSPLPTELENLTVVRFWELVDEGRLKIKAS